MGIGTGFDKKSGVFPSYFYCTRLNCSQLLAREAVQQVGPLPWK